MQSEIAKVDGYVERETISGALRTRVIHLDYPLQLQDPDGVDHFVWAGGVLVVIDRVSDKMPLIEELIDLEELRLHYDWCRLHPGAVTHTPLDLRTPQGGGREDEPIPF